MRITRVAEALHTLPYEGGLFDQPPGTLFRMEAVLIASAQPDVAKSNRQAAEAALEARIQRSK